LTRVYFFLDFGPEGAAHHGDNMPQSLSKMYAHAIFSTKGRLPFMHQSLREELYKVLGGAINNLGCRSMIVGGIEDHVHLLFVLSRTVSIAETMGIIKQTSSSWVNEQRKTSTAFAWQAGYAIFSVSQSSVNAVRKYIRNQAKHHEKQSFQDELREWLVKYEEEFDERYVWD
jgi:putative transposase